MRKKRDEGEVECVAENAHGDPVSAKAQLRIYDGKQASIKKLKLVFILTNIKTKNESKL